MSKEKAVKERYKLLKNKKYKYTPREQVMFGKDVEKIFDKEASKSKE